MRYCVVAVSFDRTLATDGRCDARTLEVLRSLAMSGRKLVLTTSRELRDLLDVFPAAGLFDFLVAENGAVVHRPSTRESAILAHAPPEILIQELRRQGVAPLCVGSSVVSTARHHRETVIAAIARLRADYRVLENDRLLTVLPIEVNKGTGVKAVLDELQLSPHNLVAIGDAENDYDLFALAEHAVAVADAAPGLKRTADRITRGSNSTGFVEFARELIETDLTAAPVRRKIVLGTGLDQHEVTLSPRECAVLMSGPKASGKAALCNSVLGQYLAYEYQCCVIGSYPARHQQDLPSLLMLGDAEEPPRLDRLLTDLEDPAQSVLINLASVSANERPALVASVLKTLAVFQLRTGRPHAIVVDQAEAVMTSEAVAPAESMRAAARVYLSSEPCHLPHELLEAIQVVIAIGEPAVTYDAFQSLDRRTLIDSNEPGQAVICWREGGPQFSRIQLDLRTAGPGIIPDERVASAAARATPNRVPDSRALAP